MAQTSKNLKRDFILFIICRYFDGDKEMFTPASVVSFKLTWVVIVTTFMTRSLYDLSCRILWMFSSSWSAVTSFMFIDRPKSCDRGVWRCETGRQTAEIRLWELGFILTVDTTVSDWVTLEFYRRICNDVILWPPLSDYDVVWKFHVVSVVLSPYHPVAIESTKRRRRRLHHIHGKFGWHGSKCHENDYFLDVRRKLLIVRGTFNYHSGNTGHFIHHGSRIINDIVYGQ